MSAAGPLDLLQLALPVFLVIGAGLFLRRAGILTAQADASMLGMLMKLFLPCLAFDAIMGNEALTRAGTALVPPLAGFLLVAGGFAVAWLAASAFLPDDGAVRRTFAVATGVPNYGYIPLPLCLALFDREAVGVLFALGLGVEVGMWTIGVGLLGGQKPSRRTLRLLFNPPLLAVVAALALNVAGADRLVPAAIDSAWHMLGVCAVPIGLLLTGAMLADHATLGVLRTGWSTTALGLAARLGVLPAIILGAALFLPLDTALRQVLVVQAAMPSAVFPIILTRLHRGDMPTALRVVVATSLASLVTIPLWLAFGLEKLHAALAGGGG
jgi:malate permease and related proteins